MCQLYHFNSRSTPSFNNFKASSQVPSLAKARRQASTNDMQPTKNFEYVYQKATIFFLLHQRARETPCCSRTWGGLGWDLASRFEEEEILLKTNTNIQYKKLPPTAPLCKSAFVMTWLEASVIAAAAWLVTWLIPDFVYWHRKSLL